MNGYGTNVCVHAPGDSGLPGTRQQSPGGWEARPGETAPGGGGAGTPRRAARCRAPAPRPARGPVAASRTGGSRPRAALGMLRRRPGRAASERASAPPASATYLGAWRPRMLQVRPGATPAGPGQGAGRPGPG